jgi:hypothetical protein
MINNKHGGNAHLKVIAFYFFFTTLNVISAPSRADFLPISHMKTLPASKTFIKRKVSSLAVEKMPFRVLFAEHSTSHKTPLHLSFIITFSAFLPSLKQQRS